MILTAFDMCVLLLIGGAAVLGLWRGFVTEVLSLLAYLFIVIAIKLFYTPVSLTLTDLVGTSGGAAVLAFAIIVGLTYFGGRWVAREIGERTRTSILGPVDRALGFGFGALKGLILASLAFLLLTLVIDTVKGGPASRPEWLTKSTTYPLLEATSAEISDFVERRRRGDPVFVRRAPDAVVDVPGESK